MRKVCRSALVPYTAEAMYALVEDVAAYPDFLPWCTGATIHARDAEVIDASLQLQQGAIRKTFRTLNTLTAGSEIGLQLVGGPFKHLAGGWQFEQLGSDGCKVSLNLAFEFENFLTDSLFGAFFEQTCNSLIDSFSERADAIYG
jgi:ribosome-associated toxin RatA of RatAB toxin-antitoxin module